MMKITLFLFCFELVVANFQLFGSNASGKNIQPNGFSWKNCGGSSAVFSGVSIKPDPLDFPGTLTFGAGLNISSTLQSPLAASVVIEKKLLGQYVKLPCIDNFGTCKYDDVCELLSGISQCPDFLVKAGIPCKCPFNMANYKLPPTGFAVDTSLLPSGDYHLQGSISSGGKQVGCLEIYVTIS